MHVYTNVHTIVRLSAFSKDQLTMTLHISIKMLQSVSIEYIMWLYCVWQNTERDSYAYDIVASYFL